MSGWNPGSSPAPNIQIHRETGSGMTAQNVLRLLPWTGPEDKPCYLGTDDREGFMSRLADRIEADQLELASELLEEAPQVLGAGRADAEKLSLFAAQLAGSLRDVLRVATSRGGRLAASGHSEDE